MDTLYAFSQCIRYRSQSPAHTNNNNLMGPNVVTGTTASIES